MGRGLLGMSPADRLASMRAQTCPGRRPSGAALADGCGVHACRHRQSRLPEQIYACPFHRFFRRYLSEQAKQPRHPFADAG